jgi:Putative polyhydroxyalkanoic acid system protein (PHA_gran_rgn)
MGIAPTAHGRARAHLPQGARDPWRSPARRLKWKAALAQPWLSPGSTLAQPWPRDRRQPPAASLGKIVIEPIVITIAHKLGKEEAMRRVRSALAKACEAFPVLNAEQETWSGDRMDFRVRALGLGRRQRHGRGRYFSLGCHPVDVTLPWLLHKFATAVQKTVSSRGRILVEKK